MQCLRISTSEVLGGGYLSCDPPRNSGRGLLPSASVTDAELGWSEFYILTKVS